MVLYALFEGMGIGFVIAGIVGPIAILCIRRTLQEGQAVGLAVGLGAAIADVVYSLIAGFGLTTIANFLIMHRIWFQVVGGLFLFYLGLKSFFEQVTLQAANVNARGRMAIVFSTFLLTMTNPITILSFAAIFTSFGVGVAGGYYGAVMLVFGVFSGAMAWWIILTSVLSKFRVHVTPTVLGYINKLSGLILIGFAIKSFLSAFGY